MKSNIFDAIPVNVDTEVFQDILTSANLRIERIVSKGQVSPPEGWYDQDQHEWVMVLQGSAVLQFDQGDTCHLSPGDYVNIPAHAKHRVSWTDPDEVTVWLAVFYD